MSDCNSRPLASSITAGTETQLWEVSEAHTISMTSSSLKRHVELCLHDLETTPEKCQAFISAFEKLTVTDQGFVSITPLTGVSKGNEVVRQWHST